MLVLCLALASAMPLALADSGSHALADYAADAWTTRNGLPHNSLRDIAQTPDGYLWFATWEGVARYNGLDFTVFDRGTRQPALPDNGVGSLYVDPHGNLWLSDTRGNLGRRTPDDQWRFWRSGGTWPQALIHAMAMDRQGRLWLLFEGRGLGCLSPDGRFEYFESSAGVPLRMSYPRMAIDDQDRIWIGGMEGLIYRDADGRFQRAPASLGIAPGLAWPYRAADGALWLVAGDGLYRLERDLQARRVHEVPGHGVFTAMLQDRHGDLWLGSENGGLLRIGRRGIESPVAGAVPAPGRIVSLLEDAEGSIWIGANGGLYRLRDTLFSRYDHRDGLSGDYVRAVLEDRRGDLWIGGAAGLDRMRADGRVAAVALHGDVAPSVLSLAEAGDGDLWVGTYAGGVFRLRDGRQLRRYGREDGLPGGHVRAIVADGDAAWVGTQRGLARIEGGRVRMPQAPGLPRSVVTALAGIDGALWIGSVEGASVLRDGAVRRLPLEALGGARTVFGFQKIGGDVWIATDRGLYRDRDGQLARVGREQGLPVDTVFLVVADTLGNAWITSNRGVLRARLDDLQAVADGRMPRVPLERYDETDGMSSAQGNGSSAPSALLRRDGSLWISTAAGISVVDPRRLSDFDRHAPPPVQIEGVWVDGEPYDWRRSSRLPGGQRISVGYVGLSFLLSERIRYRVRIDGLDAGWVDRGHQRNIDIAGLAPGDYTLRIAAAHPGGRWSGHEAAWRFTITPLWWQRRSVQVLGLLLGVLSLGVLYRVMVKRYRASNARLAQLVDERTRALQQQADQLRGADREKNELLARLREQAETFEKQAYEDGLTGLPNRRYFDQTFAKEYARSRRTGQPMCLAILDIDHFKRVNDQYSHAVGDAVLRQVADIVRGACRDMDMAIRLGGEEFAVILPQATLAQGLAVAGRIRLAVQAGHFSREAAGLAVTVSIGVVENAGFGSTEAMFEAADAALYAAKAAGRNQVRPGQAV